MSVESKQAHNVTEMVDKAVISSVDGQSLNEDDKKQHQTKETKKQLSTKQKNRNAGSYIFSSLEQMAPGELIGW